VKPMLNRLPRIRHRGGEAAIDRDCLSVDIGRLVAGEGFLKIAQKSA
jgi:hypothetical protein